MPPSSGGRPLVERRGLFEHRRVAARLADILLVVALREPLVLGHAREGLHQPLQRLLGGREILRRTLANRRLEPDATLLLVGKRWRVESHEELQCQQGSVCEQLILGRVVGPGKFVPLVGGFEIEQVVQFVDTAILGGALELVDSGGDGCGEDGEEANVDPRADWRQMYDALAASHHKTELDLQQAEAERDDARKEAEDLKQQVAHMRALLDAAPANKVAVLPKRKG